MKNYMMIMIAMLGLLVGCGIPDGYQVLEASESRYSAGYKTYIIDRIKISDASYNEIRSHFPSNQVLTWGFGAVRFNSNCRNIETTSLFSDSFQEENGIEFRYSELRVKPSVMECLVGKPIQIEIWIAAVDPDRTLEQYRVTETINVVLMEN